MPTTWTSFQIVWQGPQTYVVLHDGSRAQRRAGAAMVRAWEALGIISPEASHVLRSMVTTVSPEDLQEVPHHGR